MTFRGALKMGTQNANKSDHIAVAISLASPLAGTLEKTAPLRSQLTNMRESSICDDHSVKNSGHSKKHEVSGSGKAKGFKNLKL